MGTGYVLGIDRSPAAIRQALQGVERVIIATDPGREGSMIAWEVLEHLRYKGRVDRLKLGALDEVSIRRAFAAKKPACGRSDAARASFPVRPLKRRGAPRR